MSTDSDWTTNAPPERATSRGPRLGQGSIALLAGIALCVGLYQLIPYVTTPDSKLSRYLCGHPLEYVLLGMFCVGLAHVGLRLLAGRRRLNALAAIEPELRSSDGELAERLRDAATASEEPIIADRLQSLADLHARWKGGSVVEYATLFSERAADSVAGGYAVLNTILWAIPIVGFLGTVMGITLAIASITPEQLEGSLVDVTGNLAIAFDTTALSLGFSLVLGFASLVSRRTEDRTLTQLDRLTEAWVLPAFPDRVETIEPAPATGVDAVAEFAAEVARHRERLAASLDSVVQEAQTALRDEASQRRQDVLDMQASQWEAANEQIAASVERWTNSLDDVLARTGDRLVDGIGQSTSEAAATLAIATEQQKQWAEMLERTSQLETIQASLDSQLRRSEFTAQLDDTLHQLTAAVHLMTSRAKAA